MSQNKKSVSSNDEDGYLEPAGPGDSKTAQENAAKLRASLLKVRSDQNQEEGTLLPDGQTELTEEQVAEELKNGKLQELRSLASQNQTDE